MTISSVYQPSFFHDTAVVALKPPVGNRKFKAI